MGGPQAQDAVIAAYRAADAFAIACRRDKEGDMDGLPNVLLEAQSQGLPCVASTISAIPELITDSESGLLVPPEDPQALAVALSHLILDPALRQRIGLAGAARVRKHFEMTSGITELARRFGLPA